MELIWWIQNLFPPSLIVGVFPLIIIGCWLLAFGEWLYPKWRAAGLTYALSWLTVPFSHRAVNLDWPEAAIIGGIVVPAICGLLLVVGGSLRTLNTPSSLGVRRSLQSHPHSAGRLGRGLLGALVGTILGLLLGLLFSLLMLALLSLLDILSLHSLNNGMNDLLVMAILDSSIYTFGLVGMVLGGCIGFGWLNLQQIHQRFLISAVICSALITRTGRNFLQILHWTDSARFQVIERPHTLTLRCRVYRSSDWVGIGFNSLYDALTVGIGVIAILRGTWTTMGFGIGLMAMIALIWTWQSLGRLFNYTTIMLEPTALHCWNEPLFSFKFPLRLSVREIIAITASITPRRSRSALSSASTDYQICATLTNGKRIPIVQHLEQWQDALFIEEIIENFLANSTFRNSS